jgi:uncharacterized protein
MIQGIRVIDSHCHFPVTGAWFPDYETRAELKREVQADPVHREQVELWRKAHNFEPPEKQELDDKAAAERWYKDVIEKGIDKVIFVSGGGNRRLAEIVDRYPDKFLGLAHHNPFVKDAPALMEKAVKEQKLKGYKILAPSLKEPLNDRKLYDLWKVCEELDVPVTIHFGILGGADGVASGENLNPLIFEQVAKDFPRVRFILPHFGACYPSQLLQLCWTCSNIYVDSSGSNQWVRWMAEEITLESLFKRFYEAIGPTRMLFGTDSSTFPRTYAYQYLYEQHKIMRFLRIPEADIERILHKNAEEIFKL